MLELTSDNLIQLYKNREELWHLADDGSFGAVELYIDMNKIIDVWEKSLSEKQKISVELV